MPPQLGAGSQEIRANGARSGDNNFMLNGVDANSYSSNLTEVTPFGGAGIAIPAPDTIQEFKVQTSLYDAQYGRGGVRNVNVETRFGHGRSSRERSIISAAMKALDANNFFANANRGAKRRISALTTRGHSGGPMPWSGKRRLFLVSYQAIRGCECGILEKAVLAL